MLLYRSFEKYPVGFRGHGGVNRPDDVFNLAEHAVEGKVSIIKKE
jgi:hypothetical protein